MEEQYEFTVTKCKSFISAPKQSMMLPTFPIGVAQGKDRSHEKRRSKSKHAKPVCE